MTQTLPTAESCVRRRLLVRGQVQGVGFRPFVYRTATSLGLCGLVKNSIDGAIIEVQGPPGSLDQFALTLANMMPELARVYSVESYEVDVAKAGPADEIFRIVESEQSSPGTPAVDGRLQRAEVTVDTAACPACVAEMLSTLDRRHGYGLINCTDCGPRFTIVHRTPYDRQNTTMHSFAMCDRCASEYANPADRRFHAQPIACHECGPKIFLINDRGDRTAGDPIREAADMLRNGCVVAIKGLGGFHLAARADDEKAVRRLRAAKDRKDKPFAVMCASLQDARQLVTLSNGGGDCLCSAVAPIVLAPRREDARVAPCVAPGSHRLGVMLAYTPIHHLLYRELAASAPVPLVMTSGNGGSEPLVFDNDDAIARLGPICDAILSHERPIERAIDDSVFLDFQDSSEPVPIRRGRGLVPTSLPLGVSCEAQGLAVGGEFKSAVAIVRGGRVVLSQHLGDLTHPRAYKAWRRAIDDLCALFDVHPGWIALDAHPTYLSSAYARALCDKWGVPLIVVQHHHAHAAALMAEHGMSEPILAVVADGTGYGADHTAWGGEVLATELTGYQRLGSLRPLRLPGGDAAAHDTRRSALAMLFNAYGADLGSLPIAAKLFPDTSKRNTLCRMIRNDVRCIASSSVGRHFDGIAALLGISERNEFEAQAPMALEAAASHCGSTQVPDKPLFELISAPPRIELDLSPLVRHVVERLAQQASAHELAALFHDQLAAGLDALVAESVNRTGLLCVGLSGGAFCNERLTTQLTQLLRTRGLHVIRHRVVPPNDGGLAFGQAAIGAARQAAGLFGKDGR